MLAADLLQRMQFFRPWRAEEPVPRFGAKRHDTGQAAFEITKAHGAQQGGQITTQTADSVTRLPSRIYSSDEKDRGTRKPPNDRLRNSTGVVFQADSLL